MSVMLPAMAVGLVVGLQHALEPDHLAAVSTLVAESKTPRSGLVLGAAWGLGHASMLLTVGLVLVASRARMPEAMEVTFELLVGTMLVGLGARALARALREGRSGSEGSQPRAHRHGPMAHTHGGPIDHVHVGGWTLARRPLIVGLLHGLAGSGALAAAVMTQLPTVADGVVYILLFGLGSTLGMGLLTGVAGLPLARLARSPRVLPALLGASGALSVAMGILWVVRNAQRLF